MTSRQARKQRREEGRKAKKAAYKASLQTVAAPPAPPISDLEEEFSPEFLAEARAIRERVARRVEANRANATHSTGPVSPLGKLASSRNSLKHGLASGTLIIPGEDRTDFESLLESLLNDHQPASSTEELLIQEMAQSWWFTQRALRLQNDCFTAEGVNEKRLALFLRYQTTHERAFHKALNTLIRLQKERRRENRGFVSQQRSSTVQEIGFVSQNDTQPEETAPDPALESLEKEQPASQAA